MSEHTTDDPDDNDDIFVVVPNNRNCHQVIDLTQEDSDPIGGHPLFTAGALGITNEERFYLMLGLHDLIAMRPAGRPPDTDNDSSADEDVLDECVSYDSSITANEVVQHPCSLSPFTDEHEMDHIIENMMLAHIASRPFLDKIAALCKPNWTSLELVNLDDHAENAIDLGAFEKTLDALGIVFERSVLGDLNTWDMLDRQKLIHTLRAKIQHITNNQSLDKRQLDAFTLEPIEQIHPILLYIIPKTNTPVHLLQFYDYTVSTIQSPGFRMRNATRNTAFNFGSMFEDHGADAVRDPYTNCPFSKLDIIDLFQHYRRLSALFGVIH